MNEPKYVGFWIRTLAAVIDSILILVLTLPILFAVYGSGYWLSDDFVQGYWDVIINYVFPAIVIIIFWIYKSATPGKILLELTIVDAVTLEKPSTKQFIIRYLGYYVSAIPLLLGIIWVGFDKRKQGWHDKIAGTVVIEVKCNKPVESENQE
jgi:uncharacterized RDD family membrane protein YckC